MKMQTILSAGLGALALAVLAPTAQAAPAPGLAVAINREATSAVEQVTWGYRRHCYWHHGYRYCGWGHHHYKWGYRPYKKWYGYGGYGHRYHRYW